MAAGFAVGIEAGWGWAGVRARPARDPRVKGGESRRGGGGRPGARGIRGRQGMAEARDRERHGGWIRGGNRGGVGLGGRARAGSAEAGDREVGDGGGSLH
jgi:hypothetical protein